MFRKSILALSVAMLGLSSAGLIGCRSTETEADMTKSARNYLEKKDHRAAIIQLKNALSQNPDSVEARKLLGKALLLQGDPASAAVELRKALELKAPESEVVPDLARAMLAMGEDLKMIEQFGKTRLSDAAATADLLTSVASAQAMRGDNDKASETTAAALQVKPDYAPAMVMRAQILASQGHHSEALAELDKALAVDPKSERAGVLKGDVLWRGLQNKDAAKQAYRAVLENTKDSLGAHTALVAMLASEGNLAEAKEQFKKLKAELPDHPETLYYEAQIAFSDDDFKRTREITDDLLKTMPNNSRILELAGAAEYRQAQYVLAESFFARAIKGNSNSLLARQMLAQVQLRVNQPSKALEVLQPVLDSNKADGTSLALAGEAYMQLGDNQKADAAYKAAARAEPENARVRTAVALSELSRGESGALANLAALAASDSNPRADMALISALHQKGDYAGALKAIDALEKKQPGRAIPFGLRGHVLLTKRDKEGARKNFDKALSLEPTYFAAAAALSSMDLAEGKNAEARKRFEEFLKANPRSHQAALGLAELAARSGAPVSEVTALTRNAVKANPDHAGTRLVYIEQLINSGDPKSALVAAQEALVVMPQNADINEALGRAQLASGDAQQAITTFKKLAASQSKNPRLLVRQAEALLMLKDNPGATQAMRQALEIKSDYLPAQRGMVMLAIMGKRYDEGLSIARQIQKAGPQLSLGFQLEAEVEASRKNYDAAAAALRQSMQRAKSTETAIKLHNTLLASGKRAEAERWATEWIKDNPKDAGFRFYQADMAMARGEDATAETLYRNVLTLQPDNALAMNNIAWLMVKQGKPGAVPLAEKAVSLLADRAPLLDTLATALAADNQMAKAIDAQKRAVVLAPDNPVIRLALARHYAKAGEKAFAKAELETLRKLGDKFAGQPEVTRLLSGL